MERQAPEVTIAEFTMDDYPVVHVLWQRGDLWMRPSDGPEATLLQLARDPGLFLVARDARGRIAGTVMGGWDGRRAYVYHLAV
ncbi:MAG: GNAT family N-acetyltransferase, partial [Thermoleophilia bacterium]|nr:GNAT family N-acetyltransferase [Thermoleophilia bacterium]